MAGSKADARVAIVGAGPVGMVCALALNRSGISVTVFEQEPEPPIERARGDDPSLDLGIARRSGRDQEGHSARNDLQCLSFPRPRDKQVVAEFNLDLMRDEFRYPFALQYEQYKIPPRSRRNTPMPAILTCASRTASPA